MVSKEVFILPSGRVIHHGKDVESKGTGWDTAYDLIPDAFSITRLVESQGSIPGSTFAPEPETIYMLNRVDSSYAGFTRSNPTYRCLIENQDAAAITRYCLDRLIADINYLDEILQNT